MTFEIALVLGILVAALVLFVSEKLPMEIVALLVLLALALSRAVTVPEALSGFSNPAVITVWAMFMISAGLSRTGVASILGRRVLALAGRGETRMIIVIMLTAGVLSAFMNNIGVAALMLPVVMDIARRTHRPPSRLLMPLAFGSLLGGLTTLVGTPPNLLVSESLRENEFVPFELFDFTPVGGFVLVGGTLFFAFVGRHFLPRRDPGTEYRTKQGPTDEFDLGEKTAVLRVPPDSPLVGSTLEESRLGSAAGLLVLAVVRGGKTRPDPAPDEALRADDRLLVSGALERFTEIQGWQELEIEKSDPDLELWSSPEIALVECVVPEASGLAGQTLIESDLHRRFGVLVLALIRRGEPRHTDLASTALEPGDRLLIEGRREAIEQLHEETDLEGFAVATAMALLRDFRMRERLFTVRVPHDSILSGKTLAESRLGDAFSLGVLGILREGAKSLVPGPDVELRGGDRLLIRGERRALALLKGLQHLEVESEQVRRPGELESEKVGFVEAILSPRARLSGRSLRQLDFRQRYGLKVVAILRRGKVLQEDLRDLPLEFGDGLLLYGPREKQQLLAEDPDFVVLERGLQPAVHTERAPLSVTILALALMPVIVGWLPISIAAVAAATGMILTRCMTMEEAYRAIDWRSVFLIAGMLPLGVAMQQSGAAAFLAEGVLAAVGPLGPWGVLVGLYLMTAAATMIIPTSALVVVMAPIVLGSASQIGLSPYAAMMAVAMAASASFTSPISHPANTLVMGPGGYRFADYLKVGGLMTGVVMVVVLLILPLFWPL